MASRAGSSSAPPRAPSTPSWPSPPPTRRLAPASLPLVRGGALRPRRRAAPGTRRARTPPGEGRLRPLPGRDVARARQRRVGARPLLSLNTPAAPPAGCGTQGHVLRVRPVRPRGASMRAARPPFGDPRLRWIGHYDGTPPQAEALALDRPGARPATRGPRHRADGLQRDQREDARRPGLRRRAADDVHRRLRAGRLGAGPRPPVRGDLLLPRRRDRGGARRPGPDHPRRATSSSRASVPPTGSSTPAAGGCGGSRRRLRSHRSGIRIGGSTTGSASRKEWTDHGSRRLRRRHRRQPGHRSRDREALRRCRQDVVITCPDAGRAEEAAAEIGGSTRGIALDLAKPETSATPCRRSGRCATS